MTSAKMGVITLFPNSYPGPLGSSIMGKGLNGGKWQLDVINLRDYGRRIDHPPYSGTSPGMLLQCPSLGCCIDAYLNDYDAIIIPVAAGKPFNQESVTYLNTNFKSILFVPSWYEGLDYRIFQYYSKIIPCFEFSVADVVITNGDLAAMFMIDAIVRSSIIGNKHSLKEESFSIDNNGLLEEPKFAPPYKWRDIEVPEYLISGHHKLILEENHRRSIERTKENRPDLFEKYLKYQEDKRKP